MEQLLHPVLFCSQKQVFRKNLEGSRTALSRSKLCQQKHFIYGRASRLRRNHAPKKERLLGLRYNGFKEIPLAGRDIAAMAALPERLNTG